MEEVRNITGQYVEKHLETRCLSPKFAVGQWDNLKEYFLTYLPKKINFKSSIKETDRYKRIKKALDNILTLPWL